MFDKLIDQYCAVSNIRDRRLFSDFLVQGHQLTTLSGVTPVQREQVIHAKVCLGMLITLYDDLADNPKFFNPKLLQHLYQLNINQLSHSPVLLGEDLKVFQLAKMLFSELDLTLNKFEYYRELLPVLQFDIRHIFFANQYSELISAHPFAKSVEECRLMGPYNMGMVATGVIDLMASHSLVFSEFGVAREILIRGQRLGRIGNMLATFERESLEGDHTNELTDLKAQRSSTLLEFSKGLLELRHKGVGLVSFKIDSYAEGLKSLLQLHFQMEGII
jgi:hypothetical protein